MPPKTPRARACSWGSGKKVTMRDKADGIVRAAPAQNAVSGDRDGELALLLTDSGERPQNDKPHTVLDESTTQGEET